MGPGPETDLQWLAFRYVCGELSADESAAFEARMAQDPSACEAVADAVELVATVDLALPVSRPSILPMRRVGRARVLVWGGVAAAACLAMAVGLNALKPRKPEAPPVASAEPALMRDVALAWSGLHREERSHPSDVPSWLVETPAIPDIELSASAEDAETSPPSWLVAAASLHESARPDPSATQEN